MEGVVAHQLLLVLKEELSFHMVSKCRLYFDLHAFDDGDGRTDGQNFESLRVRPRYSCASRNKNG